MREGGSERGREGRKGGRGGRREEKERKEERKIIKTGLWVWENEVAGTKLKNSDSKHFLKDRNLIKT
jgi:hypothetical protein